MIPWLGIATCLVLLVASMAALSAWRRHGGVSAETARKLLHVEMGLVATGFPWIFDSAWQVLLLAGLTLAWFFGLKRYRRLRRGFGNVLHGVRRRSRGEFFFVAGVAAAFLLSAGEPAYYCTAILVTTLADTAAAVIGRNSGRRHFRAFNSAKSLEGSCAFFCVAFVCTLAIFAASTEAPGSIMTAALAVASITTLLEAVSSDGADNLLVPLGGLAALHLVFDLSIPVQAALLTASVGLAVAVWATRVPERQRHV